MSQTKGDHFLRRFVELLADTISLQNAKAIAEFRADQDEQSRADDLADKCTEGVLTDAEREEYDRLLKALHVVSLVQRAAQRRLFEDEAK